MKIESPLPQKKIRLLGNILLVIACLGMIGGLAVVPVTIWLSPPSEIDSTTDEMLLLDGISLDTTVRELLEKDHEFYEENRGIHFAINLTAGIFILVIAIVFLRLALVWRKAEPFGHATIVGLRWLGILLMVQFVVGWIVSIVAPWPEWSEFAWFSEIYKSTIEWLLNGGPILSSGIMFLILSWVLDYSRKIKEEQALTI